MEIKRGADNGSNQGACVLTIHPFFVCRLKPAANQNMFFPVASDVASASSCTAVSSLRLKAVRAPERITRLSFVHSAARKKVHLCGIWGRDCLTLAPFAWTLHTKEGDQTNVPSGSAAWPGPRRADGGRASCPSAAAGSASSVAQMLWVGGWGVCWGGNPEEDCVDGCFFFRSLRGHQQHPGREALPPAGCGCAGGGGGVTWVGGPR